eukprot:2502345-Prymnesium_polylepis.1
MLESRDVSMLVCAAASTSTVSERRELSEVLAPTPVELVRLRSRRVNDSTIPLSPAASYDVPGSNRPGSNC